MCGLGRSKHERRTGCVGSKNWVSIRLAMHPQAQESSSSLFVMQLEFSRKKRDW
jgi:hypothetical protein